MKQMVENAAPSGMLKAVGGTALSKVVVMGLSGVLGIITSRMMIQNFGPEAYGQFGLLASFPTLLPFADLGIAAVVINAVATSRSVRTDVEVRNTITTAFRILLVSGGIIIAGAASITLAGWWPALLGNGLIAGEGSLAAFWCLAIFGVVLPWSVGQRILVGLRKTSTQIAAQGVVAPFMFLGVFTVVSFSVPAGSFLALFSYIGGGLVSLICLGLASRSLSPQLSAAIRNIPRIRKVRSVPVLGIVWPMLIQMVALPIAMQTDRLLISHLTVGNELAQYNLASQLFGIVLQTIAAAGVALWPIFASSRSESRVNSPLRPTLWFLLGGLLMSGTLALLAPLLANFVSDGQIELDPWLLGGFIAFVSVQAMKYPVGMYMTDKRGLTFQVIPILVMVPLNLGVSWWLIGVLGPGGTVIGSAVAVLLCQVIPNLVYVRKDLRSRRSAAELSDPDV